MSQTDRNMKGMILRSGYVKVYPKSVLKEEQSIVKEEQKEIRKLKLLILILVLVELLSLMVLTSKI